jgi:hypothetical protein
MNAANASFPVVVAVVMAACAGGDQAKFDRVDRAAKALEVEISSTGGASPRSSALQKELETEVSVLEGRAQGQAETGALHAFREANDAYKYFIRFRTLDFDAVDGRILLLGTNLEVASRYGLPVETRGASQWVDSGTALEMLRKASKDHLAEANRLVNGLK